MQNKTKSKFINGMSLDDWTKRYLEPVQAVINGQEPTNEMEDGFAGFVFDGITATELIHGEEANDWECIELIEEFIGEAKKISGRF